MCRRSKLITVLCGEKLIWHYRTGLERIRKELLRGLSQEAVAKRTSLTTRTYARAEDGKPVKYSSALEILDVVNVLLAERRANAVTLDDLTLTIE